MDRNTAESIRCAYYTLGQKKLISTVTIQEIIDEAGISRNQYYACYSNRTQLVMDLENRIISPLVRYMDQMQYEPATYTSQYQAFCQMLEYVRTEQRKIEVLCSTSESNLSEKLYDKLKQSMEELLRVNRIPYTGLQIYTAVSGLLDYILPSQLLPVKSVPELAKAYLDCFYRLFDIGGRS